MRDNLRFNFSVGVFDGAFFGLATGLASYITVQALFVHSLTDSALLVGSVSAIRMVGWQLPQILTVGRVTRLARYKPMVLAMTLLERLPFFALAAVAWFSPRLGTQTTLVLTFACFLVHGIAGGLTATPWQSLIAKVMPMTLRGRFYGFQAGAANLLASGGAVAAGLILAQIVAPGNYALCFLLAGLAMMVSFAFLAATREEASVPPEASPDGRALWRHFGVILRRDANFRAFLVARMLAQVAAMSIAFYTVYAVEGFGMSEATAGLMTALLLLTQTGTNVVAGWVGDRKGHGLVMAVGSLVAAAAALLAAWAPSLAWFAVVFFLAGVSNAILWLMPLAMTLEFGTEDERPAYIGLSNSLVAPATLLAPILGGWLADTSGYGATFILAALGGLAAALVLHFRVEEPRHLASGTGELPASVLVAPE